MCIYRYIDTYLILHSKECFSFLPFARHGRHVKIHFSFKCNKNTLQSMWVILLGLQTSTQQNPSNIFQEDQNSPCLPVSVILSWSKFEIQWCATWYNRVEEEEGLVARSFPFVAEGKRSWSRRYMCSSNSCASIKACHRMLSHHHLWSLLIYTTYMTTSQYRHNI